MNVHIILYIITVVEIVKMVRFGPNTFIFPTHQLQPIQAPQIS